MPPVNWSGLFSFSTSPLELFIRGTLVYWFLFFVFRSVLKRDIGAVGIADVLVLVLVADAAQNAMSAEYRSVAEGLLLVSTILGWNLLFDFLSFRFRRLRWLFQAQAICLVRNGRIDRRNLERELISDDELIAKLRESGVEKIEEVKAAYMESDGSVSVIRKNGG